MKRNRWMKIVLATLLLTSVLHVVIALVIPHAITAIFMSRVAQQAGTNRVITPPPPTDKSRQVVKPSPDLLYATCIYDVSAGPVRVSIAPPASYWSVSLFGRNTDNFFTINAADIKVGRAELILGSAKDATAAKQRFPAATFVQTPQTTGVLLARILVLDQTNMNAALDAQKSVRCDAITG